MGAAVSSGNIASLTANSTSPNVQAVRAVARSRRHIIIVVDQQTLKQFTIATQRSFHLNVRELNALLPGIVEEVIELVFAVFDPTSKGVVDSCELFASLVLVAPQLSRETKQKEIFALFNVSTHRVGLMVADEMTLLSRTVVVGITKLLCASIADGAIDAIPGISYFENLTKAVYGEVDVLSYEDLARLCQATAEIDAFMAQLC